VLGVGSFIITRHFGIAVFDDKLMNLRFQTMSACICMAVERLLSGELSISEGLIIKYGRGNRFECKHLESRRRERRSCRPVRVIALGNSTTNQTNVVRTTLPFSYNCRSVCIFFLSESYTRVVYIDLSSYCTISYHRPIQRRASNAFV